MTVERNYRTVEVLTDLPPEQRRGAIFSGDLVLVPDPRLQDIADAWEALNAVTDIYGPEADMLGDLLDALTEENRDEQADDVRR